jgi:anti-anti-sigma regulatory factor
LVIIGHTTFNTSSRSEEIAMIKLEGSPSSVVICRPSEDVDVSEWMTLPSLTSDPLQPGLSVLIDLRHVDHVDAVTVKTLVDNARLLQSAGGTTTIVNANRWVHWRLKLVGMDRFSADVSGTLSPNVA